MRVEDIGNIEPDEKKTSCFFAKGWFPDTTRVAHFFYLQDNNGDLAKAHLILTFVAQYLKGSGRFAPVSVCSSCGEKLDLDSKEVKMESKCTKCGKVADYFKQPGLDKDEASYTVTIKEKVPR